jgi:hypothetical protein
MRPSTRDNLIYLAVGLSIAGILTTDVFYHLNRGTEMWMPSRFAFRTVYTTLLLGYFVGKYIRKPKTPLLQLATCILFASTVHVVIVFGFRQAVGQLAGIPFAGLAVPEIFLVFLLTEGLARYLKRRSHHRHSATPTG